MVDRRVSFPIGILAGIALVALAVPASAFAPYERSVAMVRREIERYPKSARLMEILARVHSRAAHYEVAARVFESAVKTHPRDARLAAGLGEVYLKQERLEEARASLERALSLLEKARGARAASSIRASLAEVHERAGRFADVARELRAVVVAGGANADVHYRLGRALDSESRRLEGSDEKSAARLATDARRHLERTIALEPNHAKAHYALGRLLMRRGERELARQSLARFRTLRKAPGGPTDELLAASRAAFEADTAVELGRALVALGDAKRALACANRALEVAPRNEGALAFRAWIYMKAKRPEQAMLAYQELLKVRPDHAVALWNIGKMHLTAGRIQQAEDHFMRAVTSHATADQWEFLSKLAGSKMAFAGRHEEFARRALESRKSPENYMGYAMALFESGRRGESERVLREGIARYPGSPDLVQGLRALGKSP